MGTNPNTFYIYKTKVLKNLGRDGNETVKIERAYGCNGEGQHAASTYKVWYSEDGEVAYAKRVGEKMMGPCDSSCGHPKNREEKWFIFRSAAAAVDEGQIANEQGTPSTPTE